MKKIKVAMLREDLKNIPEYTLPNGYNLRLFREGDLEDWVRVELAADEFENEEKAYERFNREFGDRLDEFSKRCLLLENKAGKVIGTTTGWYGSVEGTEEVIGRIHWVSIVPEYQGKGLAKPMMTAAMKILQKYHSKAYLHSFTVNYKAINMYLDYGFKPLIQDGDDVEAWTILEEVLEQELITNSK